MNRHPHHIDQARADDDGARCVIRKLRYRLRDAMHRHGPMLPDLGLTLGIVLLFTVFLAADRVIAGFVQCEAARSCPWGEGK